MGVKVDLHLHTIASDGRLTPTQLVRLAVQRGLEVIAITDHDSTEGLAEASATAARSPHLTLIPGIELSTDIPGDEVHLLAYFIDPAHQELQGTLAGFREARVDRARRMVEKLNGMGLSLEWSRVQAIAGGGAIGRPHIAQAMVEKGYVSYPQEAFQRYIGRNGPAYAERPKLSPEDAVLFIQHIGGLAVLAHPREIAGLREILPRLKAVGLVGVEVYYGSYPPEMVVELAVLAQLHGLIPCGGSDYHALGTPGEPEPGDVGPPLESVERLFALARRRGLVSSA